MFTFFKKLGIARKPDDVTSLKALGAIVVDVRTKKEYAGGHIKGSLNIPVDELSVNLYQLPNHDVPIITCCASGMRSKAAQNFLKKKGYKYVYNGGSWYNLEDKL
jgi:phage shock protein E